MNPQQSGEVAKRMHEGSSGSFRHRPPRGGWPDGTVLSFSRVVKVLVIIAAVLVVVGPAVRIAVDAAQGDAALPLAWLDEAKRQTDLDGEANLPATFSAALLGFLGLGLLALAGLKRARGEHAWPVVVMAAVAGYLGLDEACEIHESFALVADYLHTTAGLHNFAWLVPGLLVAAVGGFVVLRMARSVPPRLRRRLIIAGIVYLFGAIFMEWVTSFFLIDLPGTAELTAPQPVAYVLTNAVEEGSEMAGALLAIAAVFAELRLRVGGGGIAVVQASAAAAGQSAGQSAGQGADVGRTGEAASSSSLGRTDGAPALSAPVTTVSNQGRRSPHGGEGDR